MTLGDIFLANFPPDENGWTEIIYMEDLIKIDKDFWTTNGSDWSRKGSAIYNKYNIRRFNAKELGIKSVPWSTKRVTWNKIIAIQLQGFREKPENHSIPNEVRKALAKQPCVVLGVITSDMEIDHKDGRYFSEKYTLDDFQPMSKAANDAKREHCKRCRANNCRFDAKTLGYNISFIEGDFDTPSCPGCYWYDPVAFRQALMKGEK